MKKEYIGNITDLVIVGNGGQADETQSYLASKYKTVLRAVTHEYLDASNKEVVDIDSTHFKNVPGVIAIGAPGLRKELLNRWQGNDYISVIHEKTVIDTSFNMGTGNIIAPGVVITTNVRLGDHNIVNINSSINHNSKIGDFVTIGPSVHIAGNVTIEDGVFIGIGANISNGVKIAKGCVIGAGALVLNDITKENSVVVGVPAKTVKINKTWLYEI